MAAQSYDFTGKTVDEAIADGLKTLKLRQDQVDIEVLNKGSRGIFGIGSEPAHVRLTVKPVAPSIPQPNAEPVTAPPVEATAIASSTEQAQPTETLAVASTMQRTNGEPTPMQSTIAEPIVADPTVTDAGVADSTAPASAAVTDSVPRSGQPGDEELPQLAVELLTKLIQLMGFQGEVVASWQAGDDKTGEYEERYLLLDVRGADMAALIGRRGETLDNIQYLLRLMVNQRLRQWKNMVVDVEQYKARRVTQLTQLALRMAEQVAMLGREMSMEPMPANERRVVHLALRDHPAVYTESSGDGERRKVNIVAKH